MFEEKSLFYINPFYFKDGNKSKPKYFVVLKHIGNNMIVASLPTSQNFVPYGDENIKHGCIDLKELDFRCFCFFQNIPITENGFSFPLNTFIYGRGVDDYNLETLGLTYPVENEDYVKCGQLTDNVYRELLNCLKDASNIKRKFKRMIAEWLN